MSSSENLPVRESDSKIDSAVLLNNNQLALMQRRIKMAGMLKSIMAYAILILGGFMMLIPFLWMISTSLKDPGKVFTDMSFLPNPIVWRNYSDAWNAVPFGRYYINSIIVAVSVTLGQLVTSSMAAYAFARLNFPGRDKVFFGYLATLMIPGQVTMIPVFILLRQLGWINTYKALILPGIFTAYGTFMLRQFFLTIPADLEDAATIDGSSRFGIFFKIILPLSKPALATLFTFVFLGSWNNFFWPLIVTSEDNRRTLPVGLASFQSIYGTQWTLLMAGAVICIVPVLMVYIFNQRFFTKGIVLSGIKG